jgi:uncharacterized membrane protein
MRIELVQAARILGEALMWGMIVSALILGAAIALRR